jgi:hypothetical protein
MELANLRNLKNHEEICVDKKIAEKCQLIILDKEREFTDLIKKIKSECIETIKEKELTYNRVIKEKDDQIVTKNSVISSLQVELKTTKEYLEKQVKDLQERIDHFTNKALDSAISAPGPTTNNNKTINNNIVVNNFFTQDYIDKKVQDNFSRDHLIEGVKGVAKFTLEHIIKEGNKMLYVCTDSARQVFYFLASDGTKTKDFKSIKLINALQKPICEKSMKIIEDADQSIEDLSTQKNRNAKQERELNLSNYAMTLWTEGDLCTEVASLNKSGFSMELTKLTAI